MSSWRPSAADRGATCGEERSCVYEYILGVLSAVLGPLFVRLEQRAGRADQLQVKRPSSDFREIFRFFFFSVGPFRSFQPC